MNECMSFKEFMDTVLERISRELEPGQSAEIQQVRKNNSVVLHGLTIHSEDLNITPTIYLEAFYTLLNRGMSLDSLIVKIQNMYRESVPREKINMDFFKDYDKVKDRIVYRLVHAESNSELLKDIPHIPFWDLAVCFSYAFQSPQLGDGMILIHNSHMECWGVGYRQLMQAAEVNTPALFPVSFCGMNDVLKNMYVEVDLSEEGEEILYVLTNTQKSYGASVMLYPRLLEQIAEQLNSSFYVLPSSVHEVLILKAGKRADYMLQENTMHHMIKQINREQLAPEEVLSDLPYYFDRSTGKLTQIS